MNHYEAPAIVNIGVGKDLSIRDLAERVRSVVGYEGDLVFDTSKPDGTPRKLVDAGRLYGLGWRPTIPLNEGVRQTYEWYVEHMAS